ncbi:hypothetical protein C8J57DRAFT_1237706 [Mycena rebaudengoi]|nr:hypothetical protein C8J57DRAFT_1237706 [Mycena rebaudengoi]
MDSPLPALARSADLFLLDFWIPWLVQRMQGNLIHHRGQPAAQQRQLGRHRGGTAFGVFLVFVRFLPIPRAIATLRRGYGCKGKGSAPPPAPNFKYAMQALDIQEDGASCGFGMITLAFLAVFGIEINEDCIGVLSSLDVTHIKHHWKCILTSWHIEENGLDVKPVYNFLEYFGVEYPDGYRSASSVGIPPNSQMSDLVFRTSQSRRDDSNTTPSAQAPESRIPRQPNGQFLAHPVSNKLTKTGWCLALAERTSAQPISSDFWATVAE